MCGLVSFFIRKFKVTYEPRNIHVDSERASVLPSCLIGPVKKISCNNTTLASVSLFSNYLGSTGSKVNAASGRFPHSRRI